MQMGYVSFSENKISKLHVFEYILYLTLKGREPRIQDVSVLMAIIPSFLQCKQLSKTKVISGQEG